MDTYKHLDRLCKAKAAAIKKAGCAIPYYTAEDREGLEKLAEKYDWESFWALIAEGNDLNGSDICPWCYIFSVCSHCGYGRRHGECSSPDSTYGEIHYFLGDKNISDLPDLKDELKKIAEEALDENIS